MGGPVFLLKEGGEHVGRSPPEEPVGGSIQLRELPGRPGCELSGVHARVRELPDAVSTALSTERWAHMMAQLGRLCLVGCAWVALGPWMSNVIPSILTVPVRLTST